MTPPIRTSAHPEVVSEVIPRRQPGWITLATSADHKSVGRMYIATSLFFAAVALTELVMMRLQLIVPDNTFIRPDVFDRLLSAYGATALILFALPLLLGLFSYVVPLQVGARGMALPRLHHLSYWLYLFGGLVLYLSFLYRPGVQGTIALPPLSAAGFPQVHGTDAWLVGVGVALLGFIAWAISMVATVRAGRAPGMVWRRVPPFSWAAATVAYTLIVCCAVMLAAITMLMIDRNFSGVFFNPDEGGSPIFYQHLSSIFLAGAYISVVIGAFGAISEILPTFSRQPHFGLTTLGGSFVALAVLAVLAWMQNMLAAPIPIGFLYFAMLMAIAAAVPVGLILFNWIGTLSGGSVRMRTPMLFALGSIALTVYGLAGEMMQSIVPVGWLLAGTQTATGDTYAALIGAGVLGGFAGLYYWFPKLNGRLMGESLGRGSFWAILIGAVFMVVPMQIAGLEGMPADVYKFYGDSNLDLVNLLTSLGTLVFALGFVLTMVNASISWNRGVAAGPDPWGGSTLEWFAPSPPPVHNFDLVPDVRSGEPLADIRDAIRRRGTRWNPPPAVAPAPEPEPVAVEATSQPAETGMQDQQESAPEDSATSEDDPAHGDEGDRPVA
jgi:heme/copper-type cytochrome/quinol oxidase subunit 1